MPSAHLPTHPLPAPDSDPERWTSPSPLGAGPSPSDAGNVPHPPSRAGHFACDLDTGVTVWDSGCHAIWEWPASEPVPAVQALAQRVAAPDREAFLHALAADEHRADTGDRTIRLQAFSGAWKHVRMLWSCHRVEGGHRVMAGVLLDLTQAVLAAQEAELRAQQVELALELAQAGLVEVDMDSGALRAGDPARRVLDLPLSGALGLDDLLQRIHPDDLPRLVSELARARNDPGRVGESRVRLNDHGHAIRRLRLRHTVRADAQGSHARLLASVIDETEAALHASRERELSLDRELALDVAGLGTFRAQPLGSGRYDFDARQAAIYGLGFEARQVSTDEWLSCVHPDDREALRDIHQAILADRMMFGRIRFRIVRPSGDVRWLEVSFQRGDTRAGEPRSLYGTTLDVTDREQAYLRLGALFEHTLSGLVLLDDQTRCLDINPAACTMVGYPREALLGRSLLHLVAPGPEGTGRDPSDDWRRTLTAGTRRGVLTLVGPRDRRVTLDYVAVAGIQTGVHLVSLNDATARLAAEARLREVAARQQDDFDAFRAEIARDVHDQLGQTLGVLMFEVGVLAARTGVDVAHLQSLLQDAVVVTRELSRALRPATLDLGLVAALGELASGIVQRTDVDVQVDAQDGLPELAPAVVLGVYRIAQEALTNVVKHAGALRASIRVETVATAHEGQRLCVSIVDDGRGFVPPKGSSAGAAGSGLGLVGMSERALQIGGRLQVESRPGAGCRVMLTLPVPQRQAATDA